MGPPKIHTFLFFLVHKFEPHPKKERAKSDEFHFLVVSRYLGLPRKLAPRLGEILATPLQMITSQRVPNINCQGASRTRAASQANSNVTSGIEELPEPRDDGEGRPYNLARVCIFGATRQLARVVRRN